MDTADASLQADEIEALSSIYGHDLLKEDSGSDIFQMYSMTIRNDSNTVELRLFVKLPSDYPSSASPIFEISSPYLDGKAKTALSTKLQEVCADNPGQPILFHWFEAARQFLDSTDLDEDGNVEEADCDEEMAASSCPIDSSTIQSNIDPSIIKSGDPLTDRKSTFQAHLAPILTKDDVQNVVAILRSNSKIARAAHNMYAYRIHDGRICIQDCDDDGESQAGSRLMHLLEIMDARNVMILVSRWYGGIKLGPDRFKHISNVAREMLEKNGYGKQAMEGKKGDKRK